MENLNSPHFNSYRNGEFLQFISDTHSMVNDANQQGEGLQLDTPLTALGEKLNTLNGVYKQERGSDVTPLLVQHDDERDRYLAGISLMLQALLNHFDDATRQAAQRLLNHLKSYGSKIYYKSYQEESAIITDLISEWETNPDRAADVATVGLGDWLNHLKTVNTDFKALYTSRAGEAVNAPDTNMEDARIEATAAYRTLASHIEAYAVINQALPYDDLIQSINSLITSYNATVDKRSN